MKACVALLLLVSFSALASITPAQMYEIEKEAYTVMYKVGANPELNPDVTRVRVVDELGNRAKVEFTYEEMMYGDRTCTFYFDLQAMKTIPRSWVCNP